jgi:tRNA (guanosine-2'-O-)-methyltransferase
MRRRSPEVRRVDELLGPELTTVDALGRADRAIAKLEPFVTLERRARIEQVIARRLASVTVVFDDPFDPHNGAAVLRSCDAFGVQSLHVVERRAPFAVATTVSRGSQKWVDVRRHRSTDELLAALSPGDYELIATDPDGELDPAELRSVARLALVLGNEQSGIARDLRSRCTRAVRVPMRGFAESLNVSVSAAILLSHAVAGRPGDLPQAERQRLYARGLLLSLPKGWELLDAGHPRGEG